MRASLLCLSLLCGGAGCGPVRLGDEVALPTETSTPAQTHTRDASAETATNEDLDAAVGPSALVSVRANGGCDGCYTLSAQGVGGQPPYTFEWQDGSRDAERIVCTDALGGPLTLVVRDATGVPSAPETPQLGQTQLGQTDASCAVPSSSSSRLCLHNPSLEGTVAYNTGNPGEFDAPPWSECINPSDSNTPDVISDTGMQTSFSPAPKASEGLTYLGLTEGEQASQTLCAPVAGGAVRYLKLDLYRLDLSVGGAAPETEQAFVELWGGAASDCVRRELLWKSPALDHSWTTFCAPLRPQQAMENLFIRGTSDGSLPTPVYVLIDHLETVDQCP